MVSYAAMHLHEAMANGVRWWGAFWMALLGMVQIRIQAGSAVMVNSAA